jgi:hypothetical protein
MRAVKAKARKVTSLTILAASWVSLESKVAELTCSSDSLA